MNNGPQYYGKNNVLKKNYICKTRSYCNKIVVNKLTIYYNSTKSPISPFCLHLFYLVPGPALWGQRGGDQGSSRAVLQSGLPGGGHAKVSGPS